MTRSRNNWGPPIGEYITRYQDYPTDLEASFGSDDDLERFLGPAKQGIQRLKQVHHRAANWNSPSHVSLSTLRHVSNAAFYPSALRYFAYPSLIGGCIKLAALIKHEGKPSPFSYEYGYLCLRIIAVAVSTCLLERAGVLEESILEMQSEPSTNTFAWLTIQTMPLMIKMKGVKQPHMPASFLQCLDRFKDLPAGLDWILGWDHSGDSSQHNTLVSYSDASTLLTLLWEDRKHFLNVIFSTSKPGLCDLVFLLWRFWHRAQVSEPQDAEDILPKFMSIFWRCRCVAHEVETFTFDFIYSTMAETSELWLQREKSPAIDLQDARQVIQAFSSRFQPFGPDRRLSKRATAATTAALLRFVTPFFCPGAEDLLPALLKAAIESIWDNTTRAQDVDAFTLTLVSVFVNFGHLLANFPMGDVTKVEAVDVITESGLIDLTARLMVMLRTTISIKLPDDNHSRTVILCLNNLYRAMYQALPGELIRKKFKDEYFNWLNFRLHLLWRVEIAATDTPDSGRERELRRLCSDLWDEIGLFIGQYHETSADRLVAVNCGYVRCPDPASLLGARFQCGNCTVPYCSAWCQAL